MIMMLCGQLTVHNRTPTGLNCRRSIVASTYISKDTSLRDRSTGVAYGLGIGIFISGSVEIMIKLKPALLN